MGLVTLVLSCNSLEELPEDIGCLLVCGVMTDCDQRGAAPPLGDVIPSFIGLNVELHVTPRESRNIIHAPPPCSACTDLLWGKPLSLLPLQSLQELDVSYNRLQQLPESLGRLQNLYCLRASYNQLGVLTNEVCGRLVP